MAQNTYLEFNNAIQIVWRSGSADDPYIDRLDITRVVNQRVSLLEIPDEMYRVRISGMIEINYERFIKNTITENEFYVDYSNGFVYFHVSKEATTQSIAYKGRGLILYPTSRIIHSDGKTPSELLYKIIEESKSKVAELIDETANFEEVLDRMVIATNLTNEATDRALDATDKAEQATDLVKDAYNTTVLIYLPYVNSYNDILTTYPYPQVGNTVQVYDTGVRYRWNGDDWIPIDALGGNIPLASDLIDGLMSKQQYKKLEAIPQEVDLRVIAFFIPEEISLGVQNPTFRVSFNAEIVGIEAFVTKEGNTDTSIKIEKSIDMKNWNNITTTPLTIKASDNFDDGLYTISNATVNRGDIFRLNIPYASDILNLTVNLIIKQTN